MRKRSQAKLNSRHDPYKTGLTHANEIMQNDRAEAVLSQTLQRNESKYLGTSQGWITGNTWVDERKKIKGKPNPNYNQEVGWTGKDLQTDKTRYARPRDQSVDSYEEEELNNYGVNRLRYQLIRESRGA